MAGVKFGVFVPQGWKLDLTEIDDPVEQYETMTRVAKIADEGGWDSIWVYDHFHTVPTSEIETTFECWTATATLARDTSRVKIGQMVGCNGYRHPALYAKIASTVDVASHGRLYAGLGAGWYEHEWRAYGFGGAGEGATPPGGFPEVPERMRMFREAVEIVHRMWTEERPTFRGKHYRIDGPINEPKSARQPHPPLWLGGGGEQVTLKLVAQYGDACNVGGGNPEVCRHKLEVLKRHCDSVGRDFDTITRSTSVEPLVILDKGDDPEKATAQIRGKQSFEEFKQRAWMGTPAEIAERIRGLLDTGITYVICYIPRIAYDQTTMRRFAAEVVPLFA